MGNGGTVTILGNVTQTGGTINGLTAGTLTVGGNVNISGGNLNGGDGLIIIAGNLSISSGGSFRASDTTTRLGGAFSNTGGTFTSNGGLFVFTSKTNQTHTFGGSVFRRTVFNDGMVGYWNLDENGGTTITDNSGFTNTGTSTAHDLGDRPRRPRWPSTTRATGRSTAPAAGSRSRSRSCPPRTRPSRSRRG